MTIQSRKPHNLNISLKLPDHELLIDFGPYKKGDSFDMIEIESSSHGDFSMHLHNNHGGVIFVPVWNHVDQSTL